MPLTEILPPQAKAPNVSSKFSIVNGKEVPFDLSSWADGYAVLLFLSGSRHPVSEEMLISFSKSAGEFGGVGCRVVAVCLDSTFSIIDWMKNSDGLRVLNNVIPIISDRDAKISR